MNNRSPIFILGQHVKKVDFKALNELRKLEVMQFDDKNDIEVIVRWCQKNKDTVRGIVTRSYLGRYQFFWKPRGESKKPWHKPYRQLDFNPLETQSNYYSTNVGSDFVQVFKAGGGLSYVE